MVAAALQKAIALPCAIARAALSASAAPIYMLAARTGDVCQLVWGFFWAAGHGGAAQSEAGQAHAERLHATILSTAPDTLSQHNNGSEEGPVTQATSAILLAAQAAADNMRMSHGPWPAPAVTAHMSSSQQQPASSVSHPELHASVLAAVDPASGERTS